MGDLRYAVRQLLRSPGFTAVAVLSLSLGIAANTTIFSFVNVLLLRPPPVEAPEQLWQVWRQNPKAGSVLERYQPLSYPGYAYFRDRNRSFWALAAFDPETPFVSWNRNGLGQAVQAQFVSGDFFAVCRTAMALGRAFGPQEDHQPGADPVAVVSHGFWQTGLGGDPQVVGRTLSINGVSLTVVGVAPAGFTGLVAGLSPDLWLPFMMAPAALHDPEWHTRAGSMSLFGVGRLRPGVSAAQATADLSALTRQLERTDPVHHRDFTAAVFPSTMVPAPFRGFVGAFTAVLMGAVFLVLLIACANAANLMLARAVARRREIAVRSSIGASRWRLVRQLLTESVLLALLSGGLGLLLTSAALPMLLRLTPRTLPIRPEVSADIRVFAYTALLSLLTGILFGLVPAWQGTQVNPVSALKEETAAGSPRRSRFVAVLIVGQFATCLVLLIAGGLCLRSLWNAQSVRLGFEVRDRVTAEVNLKEYGYSAEHVAQFNETFSRRVAALPGVRSVALADYLPLESRLLSLGYGVEGHEPPAREGFNLQTFDVGPGYFSTMGTRLLQGREFGSYDRRGAAPVVIVNQALAERFWPGQDAVGRRLSEGGLPTGASYVIVGVVETGKYRSLGEPPHPVVFRSRLQSGGPRSTFVVHLRGEVEGAVAGMRRVTQEIDPRLALLRLGTLEQHMALALFPARATGLLFSLFGAVAMLLAVSGLFGVMAYSVSQRTREIGIRLALGASRRAVLCMVVRYGIRLAGAGVLAGLIGAVAATRLLRSLLLGISPLDPVTFALVSLLLAAVAVLACLVPARRAAGIDPSQALRHG
jgi:predicted permease